MYEEMLSVSNRVLKTKLRSYDRTYGDILCCMDKDIRGAKGCVYGCAKSWFCTQFFAQFCAFIAHIFCANFSSSTFFPFHFSNLLLLFIKCSAIFKYLDTQIVLKEKF